MRKVGPHQTNVYYMRKYFSHYTIFEENLLCIFSTMKHLAYIRSIHVLVIIGELYNIVASVAHLILLMIQLDYINILIFLLMFIVDSNYAMLFSQSGVL